MRRVAQKWMSLAMAAIMLFAACFGGIGSAKVYAAESAGLSIYRESDEGEPVKTYTVEELRTIAMEEEDQTYDYSGYNTYPTFKTYKNRIGPTVKGILEDAGIPVEEESTVTFLSGDGYDVSLTGKQINEDRYYYPNGNIKEYKGQAAPEESWGEKEAAPVILDMSDMEKDGAVLRFGSLAPTDQNVAHFIKYMQSGGKIIVKKGTEKWGKIADDEIRVKNGKVFFTSDYVAKSESKIYYTTDGTDPFYGSALYNYETFSGTYVNNPIVPKSGLTLKVRVVGVGKADGDVAAYSIFSVTGVKIENQLSKLSLGETAQLKAAVTPKNATNQKISWSSSNPKVVQVDAAGKVKAVASGTATVTATTEDGGYEAAVQITVPPIAQTITAKSFKKTYGNKAFYLKAKAKTKLSYRSGNKKVATVNNAGKVTLKGPGKATITITAAGTSAYKAATKKITITVKPKKPTLKKAKSTKKRTLKISWKRDKKATGYQVMVAQNKKFKKGKKSAIIRKNKTTTKTFRKLKRGKTYYYRVRAYKKVDGKKLYSAYSKTKRIKVK